MSLLPGVTVSTICGLDQIDWTSLGWNIDAAPVPAVYLGTPGPARKAVIHLLDSASGVCHVILKVPINDGARAAILREADVLISLDSEGYTFCPGLLSVDRDRGISAQTFLSGAAGTRRLRPKYLRLLRALRLPGETTSIAEHAASLQEQLLWSATSDRDLVTINAALSHLCDAHPLAAFWTHGDFAPWNIKHSPEGLALLDWEDARRGGLPLQDAFHFLHIQDYLFRQRPASHAEKLIPFAHELGVSPTQCRTLEIAYLAHSYLQRLTQPQQRHSDFLLETLRVALREHQHAPPKFSFGHGQPTSPPESSTALHIRSDLFSAVIADFNLAELPYCILSGYEEYPGRIPSDIDLMVLPAEMPRVSTLLTQAAARCGAQLIQAIQHESSAFYFVLAKDGDRQLGFLNPDCCGDYRRRGRLWLRANAILQGRRSFKNFYVLSVPDEFIYYLIKKVLKQSIDASQMRRLQGLYQRAPQDCHTWLHRFWSAQTVNALERALVEEDLPWFASNRALLLSELEASRPGEPILDRAISTLRRLTESLKRVLQPTGMCVIVSAENKLQGESIATAVQHSLEPAFRWTSAVRVTPAQSLRDLSSKEHEPRYARFLSALQLCRIAIKIRIARIRSTLAICTIDQRDLAPGGRHWLSSRFMRLVFRPDLTLVLTSFSHPVISNAVSDQSHTKARLRGRNPILHLNQALSTEENVYQASRVILQWLSTRQVRRLNPDKGPLTPSEAPFSSDRSELSNLPCLEGD
ncbi:MAG: phosphotransferase [Candidatus Korobacteraceae bacterium]